MPDEPRAASETRSLSLTALMALAQLPGLRCGALSPLARIAAPAGAPDRDALAAALHALDGDWAALPAALLDPGLSVGLVVADRESQLLGQYLWPQPQGLGPGFRVGVAGGSLEAQGPLTLEDVELSLLIQLALGSCAEVPPERFELDAAQLWTLLALVDALGTAAALRQAARASGPPPRGRFDTASGFDTGLAFPAPTNVRWDLSDVRTLTFWARAENTQAFQGNQPVVVFRSPAGSIRLEPGDVLLGTPGWRFFEVPLDGTFP